MSTFSTDSTSALLSQINELLENFARLNSNVELYTQVHLLQQKFNTLEENYNSLQNNIKTSTCNAQCENLNATSESNSVDDFLVQLLLSKSKYNPPPAVPQDVGGFDRPFFVQASAPPEK